jgi:hypothetical protein
MSRRLESKRVEIKSNVDLKYVDVTNASREQPVNKLVHMVVRKIPESCRALAEKRPSARILDTQASQRATGPRCVLLGLEISLSALPRRPEALLATTPWAAVFLYVDIIRTGICELALQRRQ